MIDKIAFLNDHWFWPIIFGAAVLFLVFIWKEWSQSGKHRILLKSTLAFLAIVSLVLIALKPALPTEETAGQLVLLTKGYEENQLDSLKKAHKKLTEFQYKPDQPVPKELNTAEKAFVLGQGLKEFDLWQLDNSPAIYLGGNSPEGIVKFNYKQENSVGDNLMLKGLYKDAKTGNRLVLAGPGGTGLDSVSLNAEEEHYFQLSAELKVGGKYLYSLVEKDSLDEVLASDPVPVKVIENDDLRVLVVNSFPTFETKYLKNFLAESGHELVVRSQITTGRYRYEYFNTERIPVNTLAENNLGNFDLLIIDAGSLRNLSAGERSAIENSVREKGLGVFVQADENFFNSPGRSAPFGFIRNNSTEVSLDNWPDVGMEKRPFLFRKEFGLQGIHTSGNSTISAYKRLGQGRMGSSVFSNTYELLLEGNTTAYMKLWSQIVEKLSKKETPAAEWEQEAMIGFKDEPFDFQMRTTIGNPVVENNNGNKVPLRQDVDIPSLWKGTTWPWKTGWNTLQQDTTTVFDYYVFDNRHWQPLIQQKTMETNRRYFDRPVTTGQGHRPLEPINYFWFFGLFLVCIGGLWLEPKL